MSGFSARSARRRLSRTVPAGTSPEEGHGADTAAANSRNLRKNTPKSQDNRLSGMDAGEACAPALEINPFDAGKACPKSILFVCDGENLSAHSAASARLAAFAGTLARTCKLALYCTRSHLASPDVLARLAPLYDSILPDREPLQAGSDLPPPAVRDPVFPVARSEERVAATFADFLQDTDAYHAIIYAGVATAWLERHAPARAVKILDMAHAFNAPFLRASAESRAQLPSLKNRLALYSRFDSVLISSREQAEKLQKCRPGTIFIAVPPCLNREENLAAKKRSECQFGIIASACDPDNVESIRWFVANVWNLAGNAAKLHIFGNICEKLPAPPANVILHGPVESLAGIYEQCDIMINPLLRGDEMRTKTVEALAHGKPVLASPAGARGIAKPQAAGIYLAASRAEFIRGLLRLQADPTLREELAANTRLPAEEACSCGQLLAPLVELLAAVAR